MYTLGALSYPQYSMPSHSSHFVAWLRLGNSPDAPLKAVALTLLRWKGSGTSLTQRLKANASWP